MNIMNLAACIAGGALMVFGAVELIRRLSFWLHNAGGLPEGKGKGQSRMALVLIPAGPEDCESLIRTGGMRVEWMALKPPCRLICLDNGDPETREIATRLSLHYQGLELCRPEKLAGLITQQG